MDQVLPSLRASLRLPHIRLGKLTLKFSIFVSFLMIMALTIFSAVFILSERNKLTADIVKNGEVFATFTTRTIYEQYLNFYTRGEEQFIAFKENMTDILSKNPDIVNVSLVGLNGLVLFDSSELTKGKYTEPKNRIITDQETMAMIKRDQITQRFFNQPNGERAIEIVSPLIETTGGHVLSVRYIVLFRSLTERMREVYVQVFTAVMPLLLVSIGLAIPFSISITNPVLKLTEATNIIRQGNFDVHIDTTPSDEIGDLAQSFNQMTGDLKKSRAEIEQQNRTLEQKVTDRTKQLDEKVGELESINKFMVGRELKMIALKEELARLKGTPQKPEEPKDS